MSLETKEIFEFGGFRLDVEERTIERLDGTKNGTLPDKTFETLVLLVRRGGHLVTKEDLLNTIWPDTVVEENNLDKRIHHLRKYLGEKPEGGSYIETVRGRGYRFVGNVKTVQVSGSWLPESLRTENGSVPLAESDVLRTELSAEPETIAEVLPTFKQQDTVNKHSSHRTFAIAALCVVLVTTVGLGYFLLGTPNSATGEKISLAILPLKPIEAANRNELYELGIADALIIQLSSSDKFVVRSLDSVRRYTDVEYDPLAAGREQKVDYILASNYQIVDSRLRITMQLLNAKTGKVDEPYKIEKTVTDIFAAQDAVAREIGAKLTARFGGNISDRPPMSGTTNEEAYRLTLDGMYFLTKRDPNKSLEAFEKALQQDPQYALAWAGKARSHSVTASLGLQADIHDQLRQSMEALAKALTLDEDLADAHSALCDNLFVFDRNFTRAEAECRRALELEPNSARSHETYSRLLASRGRFGEALGEVKTSIDLEPASLWAQRSFGMTLFWARRYQEATDQFKRVNAMDKNSGLVNQWLSWSLEQQGKEAEAYEVWMTMLRSSSQIQKDDALIKAHEAAYQADGWQGFLRQRAEESGRQYYTRAVHCLLAGEREKAFEHLENSLVRGEAWLTYIYVDPRLDALRGDPRFDSFVQKLGAR